MDTSLFESWHGFPVNDKAMGPPLPSLAATSCQLFFPTRRWFLPPRPSRREPRPSAPVPAPFLRGLGRPGQSLRATAYLTSGRVIFCSPHTERAGGESAPFLKGEVPSVIRAGAGGGMCLLGLSACSTRTLKCPQIIQSSRVPTLKCVGDSWKNSQSHGYVGIEFFFFFLFLLFFAAGMQFFIYIF